MGADRPRAAAQGGVRPIGLKPPPERLYGRNRGHALRARQERLLRDVLPRFAFAPEQAARPLDAFGSDVRTLWVEIGAGGGEHAAAFCTAHEGAALIACEVYRNGICSLLSRLVLEGAEADAEPPANLRLWAEDGRMLLRLLPDCSLDGLILLFPDPWPKARHAKRRFVHPAALPQVARVLKPGAEWRVATDDATYQAWVTEVMGTQGLFATEITGTVRPLGWPSTRYETKALRAGRQPHYWRFIRTQAG